MEAERSQLDVVGIDFGTTNSSVALVTESSRVRLASFSFEGKDRIQGGNEFTSVARGLALRAMETNQRSH